MGLSTHVRVGDWLKRATDIIAAAAGVIILAPIGAIIAVLIRRDSPGPVFFHGDRVGKGGRPFRIMKFRTMYEAPSSYAGPRLTSSEDPRITPFGRWLRNTKVNELPQLWNVLRGDMSMVGPRPEDPEIIGVCPGVYPEEVRREILSVRPGITSPASVLYHSEETLLTSRNLLSIYLNEILPDKLRLDQLYVRNRSWASDLDIIFWTLAIFIPRIARTTIPEGYLFAGPFSRLLHRHFSWFAADTVIAFTATVVTTSIWRIQGPLEWGWDRLAVLALCLALLFSAVNCLAGFNRIVWARARGEDAFGLFGSAGLVTVIALFLNYLQSVSHWAPFPALPMELVLSIGALAPIGFLLVRFRFRLLRWIAESWSVLQRNEKGVGERVLILGDGEKCQIASWLLGRGMFHHAFSIVGIVAIDDPTKQGMRLHGCRIVGGIRDLAALVKQHDARIFVYAASNASSPVRDMVFAVAQKSGLKLVFLDELVRLVSRSSDTPSDLREYLEWLQRRTEGNPLHDMVTGLPNGALLQERLQHSLANARRYDENPAVLVIDLNGFSAHGAIGNPSVEDVLKTVAKRLMTCKRESDTLARLQSHEFALLLEKVPDGSAAETILARTKALMSAPLQMIEGELSLRPRFDLYFPVENEQALWERLQLRPSGGLHPAARPTAHGAVLARAAH